MNHEAIRQSHLPAAYTLGPMMPIPARPLPGGYWPVGQRPTTDENDADRHYFEATGRWPMTDDHADWLEAGGADQYPPPTPLPRMGLRTRGTP